MTACRYIEQMRTISLKLAVECARVELESGSSDWNMEHLVEYLRTGAAFGKAVMDADEKTVLGYMAYRIVGDVVDVGRIVVHPDSRRKGIATAMVERLKEKIGHNGLCRIWIEVDATNVAMLDCLTKCGFERIVCAPGVFLCFYYG